MKIGIVITVYFPSPIYGGPASVTRDLARELQWRGHSVTILTSNIHTLKPASYVTEDESLMDGVRVVRFPTRILRPRFSYLIAPRLNGWLKQHVKEFDVLFVQYARDLIPICAAEIALRNGVGLVLQTHGMLSKTKWPRSLIDSLVVRRHLDKANKVFALQEAEKLGISAISKSADIAIVPNGLRVPIGLAKWNISKLEENVVLFVGRLHPHKRVDALIKAAEIAMKQGLLLRFRIVGPDEGDLHRLKELCQSAGVANLFEFTGPMPTSEVLREMACASVFVLPSLYEQFSIAVLEALATGIPVVITEGNHAAEILQKADAVEICEQTPHSIYSSIRTILGCPEMAARRSANGRMLIETELSLDRVVDTVEGALRTASQGH